jgi:ubiquinone/menaquinone biosynthesis C-methylase UbiE
MKTGSGETENPFWQLLRFPKLYDFVQTLAGADKVRRQFIAQHVVPATDSRILDLGCGTGDLLDHLPDCEYVGIDLNESYINTARSRHSGNINFITGDCTRFDQIISGEFDAIIALGVLHHLDDESVKNLSHSAARSLSSSGKFFSIDPCFTPDQGSLRKWFVSKDRGRAVRTAHEYIGLLSDDFETIESTITHDWGNIPWSHCVLTSSRPKPNSRYRIKHSLSQFL